MLVGPIKLIIPYHISPATVIALFPHFGLEFIFFGCDINYTHLQLTARWQAEDTVRPKGRKASGKSSLNLVLHPSALQPSFGVAHKSAAAAAVVLCCAAFLVHSFPAMHNILIATSAPVASVSVSICISVSLPRLWLKVSHELSCKQPSISHSVFMARLSLRPFKVLVQVGIRVQFMTFLVWLLLSF